MKRLLTICVLTVALCSAACNRNRSQAVNSASEPPANGSGSGGHQAEAKALLDKGKSLYQDDQDKQALEAFQQAVQLDPNLPEAHFRLALAYEAVQKDQEAEAEYKKAVESYKKYLEENPKDAEARYDLGQVYAGLHQYSDAARELRQATKIKSDDPAIYYDLGTALMRLAQYDEAASAFSKSLEIDPENYRAEDALEEAREGVKRVRAGRKHQEDLLKKQKDEELKKAGEELPSGKPAPAKSPQGF
ncbi:MAG TPA: tetratricopeptide repeat protein [Pyrinomonadaceae bacterium]|jgi:tetratricopeptide (TPR) repeat protein|nr:tetratricopeptide repeat protein [Pyrinomonadaceae bacterium]